MIDHCDRDDNSNKYVRVENRPPRDQRAKMIKKETGRQTNKQTKLGRQTDPIEPPPLATILPFLTF
jgi:hypothetical protein